MFLVSKVDKVIKIPKEKSSFTNKEDWEFKFKAGIPLDVPEEIAKSYSTAYPHNYKIVESNQKIGVKEEKPIIVEEKPKFDALEYLKANPVATEEELKGLKQSELLAICEVLSLKAYPNTSVDKLASKIAQELKIKNEANRG